MANQERRERKYVPVVVRFDAEGKMRPELIEFDGSRKYTIDKILDVRRAACQSAGGVGDRYTCRIQGEEAFLCAPRLINAAITAECLGLLGLR